MPTIEIYELKDSLIVLESVSDWLSLGTREVAIGDFKGDSSPEIESFPYDFTFDDLGAIRLTSLDKDDLIGIRSYDSHFLVYAKASEYSIELLFSEESVSNSEKQIIKNIILIPQKEKFSLKLIFQLSENMN